MFLRVAAIGIFAVALLLILSTPQRQLNRPQPLERNTAIITPAGVDERTIFLTQYLAQKNSPLQHSAVDFIEIADEHNIDWTLLPAIAGLESSYGKRIPKNSYNPFGWGHNNGQYTQFPNWEAAIAAVAGGLRTRYVTDGPILPDVIGPRYAESPTWAIRVNTIQEKLARSYDAQQNAVQS